ncbi:hypothetical protein [Ruegeria sp. MALMAid1280]|uniref:hypothetical protein n=1 Tax=Ruegeria sp. MALMAid1280 TaxID=3411634 RepID=UPI003BA150C1
MIKTIILLAVLAVFSGTLAEAQDAKTPMMQGLEPGADVTPNTSGSIRMMLKVQIPPEAGSKAIQEGKMGQIFSDLMQKIKPEAAYFSQEDGVRTAYFFYWVDRTYQFADIHEPLIQGLGAKVYDSYALTWDDIAEAQKDQTE